MLVRTDKGELWETTVFRILADKYGPDAIRYWRTIAGNEVDFILSDSDKPKAIEVKYDKNQVKPGKYKIFKESYPGVSLNFYWFYPFDQDFFRRIFN